MLSWPGSSRIRVRIAVVSHTHACITVFFPFLVVCLPIRVHFTDYVLPWFVVQWILRQVSGYKEGCQDLFVTFL